MRFSAVAKCCRVIDISSGQSTILMFAKLLFVLLSLIKLITAFGGSFPFWELSKVKDGVINNNIPMRIPIIDIYCKTR